MQSHPASRQYNNQFIVMIARGETEYENFSDLEELFGEKVDTVMEDLRLWSKKNCTFRKCCSFVTRIPLASLNLPGVIE